MQAQSAETLCASLRLGGVNLISMPSESLPRRVDWGKWVDCIAAGLKVLDQKIRSTPRITMSPDHVNPEDSIAIGMIYGQGGLEHIDLIRMLADVSEPTRFLFVGGWFRPIPSWFSSLQSVFNANYGSLIPDQLTKQMNWWKNCAEKKERDGFFLVSDDLGRLSALTSIARNWRSRQVRSGVLAEARSPSWCAASVDVFLPKSSEGQALRLHRLAVLEPEAWCGSPRITCDEQLTEASLSGSEELWISAPGAGLALWIGDQFHDLKESLDRIRMPGAILGWHPLRDLIAFLSDAPSGSLLYLVDQSSRLQILRKDEEPSL